MHRVCTTAVLLSLAALPALAQTTPAPAPALPAPVLNDMAPGDSAPPQAFIAAALHAIATGRLGAAGEAIERAESRALDRAVKPSLAGQPSVQPLVQQLSAARTALAAGDRLRAVTLLEAATKAPEAAAQ